MLSLWRRLELKCYREFIRYFDATLQSATSGLPRGHNMNMQPLKPEHRHSILENNPEAQAGDIEEYERLISMRFAEDPDSPSFGAPESDAEGSARNMKQG